MGILMDATALISLRIAKPIPLFQKGKMQLFPDYSYKSYHKKTQFASKNA